MDFLTGCDEQRRLAVLAAVVGPLEGGHKHRLAHMLLDFLRRASPTRRRPTVESLAAIGPDAANAIVCGLCDSKKRKLVADLMRAAELLAPRLGEPDRSTLFTALYIGVRKSTDPEVLLAHARAVAAIYAACRAGRAAGGVTAECPSAASAAG